MSCRFSCSIEEEESVVITGGSGYYSWKKVTKYQMNGKSQSLPDLLAARYYHACGLFTNSDEDLVNCKILFSSSSCECEN